MAPETMVKSWSVVPFWAIPPLPPLQQLESGTTKVEADVSGLDYAQGHVDV